MGAVVLVAVAVCLLGLVMFRCWIRCTSKARFAKAEEEVSNMESTWKASRMLAVAKSDKSCFSTSNSQFFWQSAAEDADDEVASERQAFEDAKDSRETDAVEAFDHKLIEPRVMSERRVKIHADMQHHGMDTE